MSVSEREIRERAAKAQRAAEAAQAKVREIEEAREREAERRRAARTRAMQDFEAEMVRSWPVSAGENNMEETFHRLSQEAQAEFERALRESDWGSALLRLWAVRTAQRMIASQLHPTAERLGLRPPHEPALRDQNAASEVQNVFSRAAGAGAEELMDELFWKPRRAAADAAEREAGSGGSPGAIG